MVPKNPPLPIREDPGQGTGRRIRNPERFRLREEALLQDCLDRLNEAPGLRAGMTREPARAGDLRPDAAARLERGGATQDYRLEALPRPDLQGARLLRNRSAAPGPRPLLCVPAMPRSLGLTLREEGLEFVDAAGNMFLDSAVGFVWIEGRRAPARPGPARWLSAGGLKLVSVLLRDPLAAGRDYRSLAKAAGLSLGAIGWILSDLRGQDFVRAAGSRTRRLANALALLALWERGYAERLRPKLWRGAFRPAPGRRLEDLAEAAAREPGLFLAGGELGASLLLGGLRPETAVMHIRAPWREAAVRLRLLPDPEGTVSLLDDFGADLPGPLPGLAHPLFLRAELLLGRGRRSAQAAEALLRDHLRPALADHAQA